MSTLAIVLFIWAAFFTAGAVYEGSQATKSLSVLVSGLGAYVCMIAGTVVALT